MANPDPQYSVSNLDITKWTRIYMTAMPAFAKEVQDETLDRRVTLALLKKHGCIRFNQPSYAWIWTPRYKVRDLDTYVDGETITATRKNVHGQAIIGSKMRQMNDLITRHEQVTVKGSAAIVNLWKNKKQDLLRDFSSRLDSTFYEDGHTTAAYMNGIASFAGATANAQRATCNDTYAGLSTAQGNYGGSSYADPEYHFWSPVLIDETYDGWGATDTWAAEGDQQLRYAIIQLTLNNDAETLPDVALTTATRYWQLLALLEGSGRVPMVSKKMQDIGFQGVTFDGVDVTYAINCTASHTYVLTMDKVRMLINTPTLCDFHIEWSNDVYGWKLLGVVNGNYQFLSPRHFADITATT